MHSFACFVIALACGTLSVLSHNSPSFIGHVVRRGADCTAVFMNEYLVVTAFRCVTPRDTLCSPDELKVYYGWDEDRKHRIRVKRIVSPASNRTEGLKSSHGIAFLQVHERLVGTFYPPCELPGVIRTGSHAFAHIYPNRTDELVFLKDCETKGYYDSNTFCSKPHIFRTLSVFTAGPSSKPKCIMGVEYEGKDGETFSSPIDVWWKYMMNWFLEDEPEEWTYQEPLPIAELSAFSMRSFYNETV